ncbi:MAG TPA: hypothetical protein VMR62_27280 [Bryobacteraceae bacterium]|jgi:hypothetical protein|nr:hypothetical protein [Bryobacteraceae bacterium]
MRSHARLAGRAGILCGVIGALSSAPVFSQAPTRPLHSIFGVYGRLAAGQDSIRIGEKPNGRISVVLRLYYSMGHTCQVNHDGEWRKDHVAVVADGLDANRQCKLNLFFENGGVRLQDEGLQCAPVYCGSRGKLDNVNLPKFSPNHK